MKRALLVLAGFMLALLIAAGGRDKIAICHQTSSDTNPWETIEIPESAWPAHEAHGDYLGACVEEVPSATPTDSPTATPVSTDPPYVEPTSTSPPEPTHAARATRTRVPTATMVPTPIVYCRCGTPTVIEGPCFILIVWYDCVEATCGSPGN